MRVVASIISCHTGMDDKGNNFARWIHNMISRNGIEWILNEIKYVSDDIAHPLYLFDSLNEGSISDSESELIARLYAKWMILQQGWTH